MRASLAVLPGLALALASLSPATSLVAAAAPSTATPPADATLGGPATPAQVNRGARIYRTLCLACHLPDGKGMPGLTPPLAGSDFLSADRTRAIRIVLKGQSGVITVNGAAYQGLMPGLESVLIDAQVADVLTYVFNSWGNCGEAFSASVVAVLRGQWRSEVPLQAPPTALP